MPCHKVRLRELSLGDVMAPGTSMQGSSPAHARALRDVVEPARRGVMGKAAWLW